MLVAIIGLFVVSTLAVVTDIEYYLVQFPSALGTSLEDIQALMNGLDIVGVVTVRISVREITSPVFDAHLQKFYSMSLATRSSSGALGSSGRTAALYDVCYWCVYVEVQVRGESTVIIVHAYRRLPSWRHRQFLLVDQVHHDVRAHAHDPRPRHDRSAPLYQRCGDGVHRGQSLVHASPPECDPY